MLEGNLTIRERTAWVVGLLPPLDTTSPVDQVEESLLLLALQDAATSDPLADFRLIFDRFEVCSPWIARSLVNTVEQALAKSDLDFAVALADAGLAAADQAGDTPAYCRLLLLVAEAQYHRERWKDARSAWQTALVCIDPGQTEIRAICHQNIAQVAMMHKDWAEASYHYSQFLLSGPSKLIESTREIILGKLAQCYVNTDDPVGAFVLPMIYGNEVLSVAAPYESLSRSAAMAVAARLGYFGRYDLADQILNEWRRAEGNV